MVYAIQVSLREDIVARSGRYTDEYEEEIRHRQVQDQQVRRVPHARVALHLGGILVLEDIFRFQLCVLKSIPLISLSIMTL